MQKVILLLLLIMSLIYYEEVTALSSKEERIMLALHNEVREYLHLPLLAWDSKIALEAQKYAETLAKKGKLEHSTSSSRSGRGENLYMISFASKAYSSDGSDAFTAWLGESTSYSQQNNTCARGKVCGHFTQIIWKDTRNIGCGKANKKVGKTTKIYWVCQYDPPGNIIGRKPY